MFQIKPLIRNLTFFFLTIILCIQGFGVFQNIEVRADITATNTFTDQNTCSKPFTAVNLTGAKIDVGPCIDPATGIFYYNCDMAAPEIVYTVMSDVLCTRKVVPPAGVPADTVCAVVDGAANRDKTYTLTNDPAGNCKKYLTDICTALWDDPYNTSDFKTKCKDPAFFPEKPKGTVINNDLTIDVAACKNDFNAADETELAALTPPIKKGTDGKYSPSICKDGTGKILQCLGGVDQTTKKGTNCIAKNAAAKNTTTPVEGAKETKNADNGSLGSGLVGIFLGILSIILLVIFYILNWALSFILWILGLVFINILVINPVSVEYIEVAKAPWQILVNIANLLTLASLIFVGVGYILNIKNLKIGIQQLLLNVTIFSLLLNFTLLGLQGVTTITQGLGDAMITARSGTPPAFLSGGQNKLLDSVLTGIKGISLIRCGNQNLDGLATKCQTGATDAQINNATDANGFGEFGNLATALGKDTGDILSGKIGDKILRAMMLEVVYTMVLIYAIITLFKAAIMVLVRLVAFWLLLIVSPLALAAYFMPVPSIKKYAGQWAEKTWQLAIFYPVAILLLILISEIVSQFAGAINKSVGGAATNASGGSAYLDTIQAYAATGDFGGVFTAMVSTILVGFIGVVAFGTMSTFLDKFLGPIAKALGDGIKQAASTLGTAGYITGGALRFGGKAINKATGGLTKDLLNRSPIGRQVAKILPQRLLDNRLNKAKNATIESGQAYREIVNQNKINKLSGMPPIDTAEAKKKYMDSKKALMNAKKLNDRYKGAKGVLGSSARKVTQNQFVKGMGKFAGSASNIGLDLLQYGVGDLTNIVSLAKTATWGAAGKSRQAAEAERKARLESRFGAWAVKAQSGDGITSQVAQGMLLNTDLGKNFDYELGAKTQMSEAEIQTAIKNAGQNARDKVQGNDRAYKSKQIKNYIKELQGKSYDELSAIQKTVVRDMAKRIADDEGIAIAVVNDENTRNWFARNIHDVTDSDTLGKIVKTRAGILQNSDGTMGNGGAGYKTLDAKLEDDVMNRAATLASMSPDARKLEGVNTSLMAPNDKFVETVRSSGSNYYSDLITAGGRNKAVSGAGAYAKYNGVKDGFTAVKDPNGKVIKYTKDNQEYSTNEYSKVMQALLNSTNERIHDRPDGQNVLENELARAKDSTQRKQAWDKFYQGEFGLDFDGDLTSQESNISNMALQKLEDTNQGRRFIDKYGDADWKNLSDSKKLKLLQTNAMLGLQQFAQNKATYKNDLEDSAKVVARNVDMSRNLSSNLYGVKDSTKRKKVIVQDANKVKVFYDQQQRALSDLQTSVNTSTNLQSVYGSDDAFTQTLSQLQTEVQSYIQAELPKLQQQTNQYGSQLQELQTLEQADLKALEQTRDYQTFQTLGANISTAQTQLANSDQQFQVLTQQVQQLDQQINNSKANGQVIPQTTINELQIKSNQLANAGLILNQQRSSLKESQAQYASLDSKIKSEQSKISTDYASQKQQVQAQQKEVNQQIQNFSTPSLLIKQDLVSENPVLSTVGVMKQQLNPETLQTLSKASNLQEMASMRTNIKTDAYNVDLGDGFTVGEEAQSKFYTKLNGDLSKVGAQGYITLGNQKFDFSDPNATPERMQEMVSAISEMGELSKSGQLTPQILNDILSKTDCFKVPSIKKFQEALFNFDSANQQVGAASPVEVYKATIKPMQAEFNLVNGSSNKMNYEAARVADRDIDKLDSMIDGVVTSVTAGKIGTEINQRAASLVKEQTQR